MNDNSKLIAELKTRHTKTGGNGLDWCHSDEDDWPCEPARLIAALESAEAELVRLRSVIAEVKDCTRYTLNSRWALNRISRVIIRDSMTGVDR